MTEAVIFVAYQYDGGQSCTWHARDSIVETELPVPKKNVEKMWVHAYESSSQEFENVLFANRIVDFL